MNTSDAVLMDNVTRHKDVIKFQKKISQLVKGQSESVETVVDVYEAWLSGSTEKKGRPISSLLFLGPTGTGKTKLVESFAEVLLGDPRAIIKIDCAEFQHSHEIAKLIGSPPGYLGHRETKPILEQSRIDKWHTDKCKVSILLFDEIEKASDVLYKLLLGVLDKGKITMGDNSTTDLTKAIIFFTSNLGSNRMASNNMGLVSQSTLNDAMDLRKSAMSAARKFFSMEFINRLDYQLVFNRLDKKMISEITDLEVEQVAKTFEIAILLDKETKTQIVESGFSLEFGARYLKRYLEKMIARPLIRMKLTGQYLPKDNIKIEYINGQFVFYNVSKKINPLQD